MVEVGEGGCGFMEYEARGGGGGSVCWLALETAQCYKSVVLLRLVLMVTAESTLICI